MAQQLMSFTRRMMEQVIADHSTRTDHDGHCCSVATEYAARLGRETTSSPAPQAAPTVPETLKPAKTPAQRKARKAEEDKQATDRQLDFILSLGRRVSINLISPTHRTRLQHVREGFGLKASEASDLIEAMQAQTDQRPREASDRQIRYIHTLVKTREWGGTIDFENLTSAVASGLINDLKAAPRKQGADKEEDIVHSSVSMAYPEEGFYFAEGTYYKVQEPKAQGGRRFGKLYGRCIVKDCDLTNEHSIELGYGPTCAKNMGWPY
jgi:hypothetical protein